jgi:hypothetical protein
VKLRGTGRKFQTAKRAYIWLMDNLVRLYPDPFDKLDWRTEFLVKGTRRLYLAPDPQQLFFGSPHLADDRNNYEQLSNGWFLNQNLGNDQTFDILARMAALAHLEYGVDWSWKIIGDRPMDLHSFVKRLRDGA